MYLAYKLSMATVKLSARYFGYYGLIAAIVFSIMLIVDVILALQTSWNPTNNSISDLSTLGIADGAVPGFSTPGSDDPNYGANPYYEATRFLFTTLATVGGVTVAIYGIGVMIFERGHAKIGGRIFILTGLLLALIGAYNRLYCDVHFIVSMLMCLTMIVGIAFVVYEEIKEKIYFPGIAIALCALFSAICWILEPMKIVPFGIAEIITFFVVIAWLLIQAIKIFKRPQCIDEGNTIEVIQ